ncbi:MAG: metal ABC transporter substrate-binding protein [bacterium]
MTKEITDQGIKLIQGGSEQGQRRIRLLGFYILICLILILASCGNSNTSSQEKRLKIVTSTTMIQSIVSKIGERLVEVEAIVPAGMCPGHFDIKPRQVAMISDADLVIIHGWESWLENLPTPSKTEFNSAQIKGNWLVPEVHIQATRWIADLIASVDPANSHIYHANADRYISMVNQEASDIKKRFEEYNGLEVICSQLQSEFVTWLGLTVLATYGRSEDLTPTAIANIINLGKKANVRVVIDNLQSGPEVGIGIAYEIGAQHVVLSNFPDDGGYIATLRENAEKIEDGIRKYLAKRD